MNNVQTDKIILNLADDDDLAEEISRLEPGDTKKLMITARLDDVVNKVATFTVAGVKCTDGGADDEPEADTEDASGEGTDTEGEGEGEPAAPTKKKKKAADNMDEPAVMAWAGGK